MFGFIQRSLVIKLVSLILAVELLVAVALVHNHEYGLQQYLKVQIEQETQAIQRLLADSLAPPLYVDDKQDVKQRVGKIRKAWPQINYIAVETPEGHTVAHIGDALPATPATSKSPIAAIEQGVYHSAFAIELAGEVVGLAQFGFDLHQQQILLHDAARTIFWLGLLGAALGSLLLGFLLYRVTQRIKQLDAGVYKLVKGQLDTRVDIPGKDEISRLAASFNHMAETVAKRQACLEYDRDRFRTIADRTYAWEIWLNVDFELLWSNPASQRLTGYTVAELMAMDDFPNALQAVKKPKQEASDEEDTGPCVWNQLQYEERGSGYECRIRRKDGSEPWVAIYWQPTFNAHGEKSGTRVSFLDITVRRKADMFMRQSLSNIQVSESRHIQVNDRLQKQQTRFRALLSAMDLGILFETLDRWVEYVNPAFKEIWGLDKDTVLQHVPVSEVLEHLALIATKPSNASRYLLQAINTHDVSEPLETRLDDDRVIAQLSYPVYDNDMQAVGRLWVYEDVTRGQQTAEQMLYLAERDSLTGLWNRHRFELEMGRMMDMVQRYGHRFAVLYFDLDEFKDINDTYGHHEGDAVLTRISSELLQVIRINDVFARLGGDEFVILSMIDKDIEEVTHLAHRIVSTVSRIPFCFLGQNIRLTASLGISVYPDMTNDPDTLVMQADAAMYQAKMQGKNTWLLYDKKHVDSNATMKRMTWSQRIGHGLENGLFELHYQGIYNVQDKTLSHLEALVHLRDNENEEKLYLPTQFIPGAERSGKVLAIDRWVLQHVIGLLSQYENMPAVAVNISGRSFDDPTLAQQIHDWLHDAKVSPSRLLVELTETSAVTDIQDAQRFIETLHKTGCMVCLDDFGAGFSSFAYLKHITADVLKIDGQFIYDLPNDPENQLFLRAILDVAKGLRKQTVAEYVENEQVFEMLKILGVDMVQGYYLDRPQRDHPALPFLEKK
jgi:diguanylate cyclase (GGDEF)-like protein/PAS domain S-box-containing protein